MTHKADNTTASPATRPLRVAVVGAGYFAQFHLDAWERLAAAGLVELVAIVDADADRLGQACQSYRPAASFTSMPLMLAAISVDLLDIATPPATHHELVSLAAAHGIDCIVQKPLAPDWQQAQAIVDCAAQAGIRLVVHENFRRMPWFREMRRCLDAGMLGTPHSMSVRLRPGDGQGASAYLARQAYFQQMPRFLVHETAIHFVDSFRYLLGEVVAVTARLRRLNPAIAGEDAGYILLEFAGGATALIDGNRLNDHSAVNPRLTMGEQWLEGSAGVMRLDGDGVLHFKPHGAAETVHDYQWENRGFGGDCVFALQQQVVMDIAQQRASINTGEEYLRNIEIEEAIYDSHEEGRTIDLS